MKEVKFLNLKINDDDEKLELLDVFQQHLASGKLLISDDGDEFENLFRILHHKQHCVAVNTGTDALTLGIRLLGLPRGSLIITSPFSWIASSSSILLAGCQPCFVDIEDNLQLDLDLVEDFVVSNKNNVKALLIPHLHGNVSSSIRLQEIREKYNIKIIEDCAQSFMARDCDGILAGTTGDVSAFSFNPMKVLGALGDAGAVLFDNTAWLGRAKRLRHSGLLGTLGLASEISSNCRMDALQASLLLVRLKYYERKAIIRRNICRRYNQALRDYIVPVTENDDFSNHYCYQTLCDDRDELIKCLNSKGIEARIRHNFLITDHPAFSGLAGHFPNAQRLVSRTLCLPMHHQLQDDEVDFVIDSVKGFYE